MDSMVRLLCIGEEVEVYGLSHRAELNGKRGWIVAVVSSGRYEVWFGPESGNPVAVGSDSLAPTVKTPFNPDTYSLFKPICPKELKHAFADNLQRPLVALLQRLKEQDIFARGALEFPSLVLSQLETQLNAFMSWRCYVYTLPSVRSHLEDELAAFRNREQNKDPVIVTRFRSLSDFRKRIAKQASKESSSVAVVEELDIISVSELAGQYGSSFDVQMNGLRQLPLLEGYCGVCVIVKLPAFEPTTLPDTFLNTTCININNLAKNMQATVPRAYVEQHFSTNEAKAYDEALRELKEIRDNPLHQQYVHLRCAVCDRENSLLSGSIVRLQRCSNCGVAAYCGKEHQREHWSKHKFHCKMSKRLREKESEALRILENTGRQLPATH